MRKDCCFFGKHQYNVLRRTTGIEINFPYKCTDLYGRTIVKNSPDDLGTTSHRWFFPDYSGTPVFDTKKFKGKFKVIDGGCLFVKCFLEFYNWDFREINFSLIKTFASSILAKVEPLIRKVKMWGFNAIFFQDEFGYSRPWFSPEFFENELLPFYIKVGNLLHQNGLLFFLHSCGKNPEFFRMLKGYVDVWHRGDWENMEEIEEIAEMRDIPLPFIDTSETSFRVSEVSIERNHIIYINE